MKKMATVAVTILTMASITLSAEARTADAPPTVAFSHEVVVGKGIDIFGGITETRAQQLITLLEKAGYYGGKSSTNEDAPKKTDDKSDKKDDAKGEDDNGTVPTNGCVGLICIVPRCGFAGDLTCSL